MLIAPQAAIAAWDGTDPPLDRVVEARSRWGASDAAACDYDRACDVYPESAAAPSVGPSWGVVIGTADAWDVVTADGEYLTFVRFGPADPAP